MASTVYSFPIKVTVNGETTKYLNIWRGIEAIGLSVTDQIPTSEIDGLSLGFDNKGECIGGILISDAETFIKCFNSLVNEDAPEIPERLLLAGIVDMLGVDYPPPE